MPADTYTLEITDGNGCPTQTFTGILLITEPDDITATLDGSTDVSCFNGADGSAQVTVEAMEHLGIPTSGPAQEP